MQPKDKEAEQEGYALLIALVGYGAQRERLLV